MTQAFNRDCMEAMREFPDKFFDLAIVDPPFGLSDRTKNKFRRHKQTGTYTNKSIPGPEYFIELERVSKASIIWGCQYMMPFLNPNGSFIVWDKKADPDLHNMSSCDIAWYSNRDRIRTFRGHWCGAVKFENEPTIHIHQKPVALYKWILKHYAEKEFKLLDTHLGSGSSRIAAESLGFDFWGYELDSDYFEKHEKRFSSFISQTVLSL